MKYLYIDLKTEKLPLNVIHVFTSNFYQRGKNGNEAMHDDVVKDPVGILWDSYNDLYESL